MKDSYGYDGISTKILKEYIPYIKSSLTDVCNFMISTGIFPMKFKVAEIKPLYVQDKIANTTNYRHISLLTSFTKMFEIFFILDQFAISNTTTFWLMSSLVSELNHLCT